MLPFWIQNIILIKGEIVIYTIFKHLYQLVFFLRHHTNALYHTVPDLTAIDYPEHKQRFEVVYQILSTTYGARMRIVTIIDEMTPLPSISTVYDGTA
jgi:NADH:ubiquinone oxidoreductase subunit C